MRAPNAKTSLNEPQIRRGAIRVTPEVASHLRAGHPYLFRDALGGKAPHHNSGDTVEVVDSSGEFVGRGIYDGEGVVAVRLYTCDPNELIDAAEIRRRVESAARLRDRFRPQGEGNAYRLIHGEGDGLPGVTVDRYGDYLVAHLFSASLEPLRDWLYDALADLNHPKGIYEQRRYRSLGATGGSESTRGPATLERGEAAPIEFEVSENGLRFVVDVTAPLGTGLFADLREGRKLVSEVAGGRRLLNLFSYTAAFSVYAATAGALETVSVDLAPRAQLRARRNFELNGLIAEGGAHEFLVGDALKFLYRFADRKRQFDLVVIDPPSFSQMRGKVFSAAKDYRELVTAAFGVCAPGALVACASNMLKLSADDLDRAIGEAAYAAAKRVRIVERRGLPADFPVAPGYVEGHYLKFFLCAVE